MSIATVNKNIRLFRVDDFLAIGTTLDSLFYWSNYE